MLIYWFVLSLAIVFAVLLITSIFLNKKPPPPSPIVQETQGWSSLSNVSATGCQVYQFSSVNNVLNPSYNFSALNSMTPLSTPPSCLDIDQVQAALVTHTCNLNSCVTVDGDIVSQGATEQLYSSASCSISKCPGILSLLSIGYYPSITTPQCLNYDGTLSSCDMNNNNQYIRVVPGQVANTYSLKDRSGNHLVLGTSQLTIPSSTCLYSTTANPNVSSPVPAVNVVFQPDNNTSPWYLLQPVVTNPDEDIDSVTAAMFIWSPDSTSVPLGYQSAYQYFLSHGSPTLIASGSTFGAVSLSTLYNQLVSDLGEGNYCLTNMASVMYFPLTLYNKMIGIDPCALDTSPTCISTPIQ